METAIFWVRRFSPWSRICPSEDMLGKWISSSIPKLLDASTLHKLLSEVDPGNKMQSVLPAHCKKLQKSSDCTRLESRGWKLEFWIHVRPGTIGLRHVHLYAHESMRPHACFSFPLTYTADSECCPISKQIYAWVLHLISINKKANGWEKSHEVIPLTVSHFTREILHAPFCIIGDFHSIFSNGFTVKLCTIGCSTS